MDLTPGRSKNKSFGELMADIDDRTSFLSDTQQSPLLSRGIYWLQAIQNLFANLEKD